MLPERLSPYSWPGQVSVIKPGLGSRENGGVITRLMAVIMAPGLITELRQGSDRSWRTSSKALWSAAWPESSRLSGTLRPEGRRVAGS
jgi:hypothetical protein